MKIKNRLFLWAALLMPGLAFALDNPLDFDYPPTDVSVQLLGNIFGIVDGVLAGSGSQIMGQLFGVFNAAVLAIGAIIITYTLFVSTLNTAHEGEFIGRKWSSIWIPVRSAAGIALLLPKASGYSIIQVFVMSVVVYGVGAADAVWDSALNYLERGGVLVEQAVDPTDPEFGKLTDEARDIFKIQTCMYGLQEVLEKERLDNLDRGYSDPGAVPDMTSTLDFIDAYENMDHPRVDFPGDLSDAPKAYRKYTGMCGHITWSKLSAEESATLSGEEGVGLGLSGDVLEQAEQARTLAVQQFVSMLAGPAQTVARNQFQRSEEDRLPIGKFRDPNAKTENLEWFGSDDKSPLLRGTELKDGVAVYYGVMRPTLRALEGLIRQHTLRSDVDPTGFIDQARARGWILAGSYYFDLSQLNTMATNVLGNEDAKVTVVSDFNESKIGDLSEAHQNDLKTVSGELGDEVNIYLRDAQNFPIDYGYEEQINIDVTTPIPQGRSATTQPWKITIPIIKKTITLVRPVDFSIGWIFEEISTLLSDVWRTVAWKFFSLIFNHANMSQAQVSTMNPIIGLAELGRTMISVVQIVWIGGAMFFLATSALGLIPGFSAVNYAILSFVLYFIPLLTVILSLMFVSGAMMAFYIPLVPFIIFTLGALSWFIAVIEAMVAAPIVAIGIAHPEGQSQVFGRADPAVMLLLNVFLRPSMMIFGFIGGIILSYVGIWLLNVAYAHGVRGIFAVTGIFETKAVIGLVTPRFALSLLTLVAAIVIYGIIATIIVQKAFALIYIIPDKVLRWLQGGFQESLGQETARMIEEVKGGAESAAKAGGDREAVGAAFKEMEQKGKEFGKEAKKRGAAKKAGMKVQPKGGGKGKPPTGSDASSSSNVDLQSAGSSGSSSVGTAST